MQNVRATDLTIVIVNWNSKDYLDKCIASILSTTKSIEFETVVIDGASFDGCGEMLEKKYPQVHFIQSKTNMGFAKANNEAFTLSSGRNILFLNPDTEIKNGAIETLFCKLESLPNAAIVGAKLLNSDGTIQTSCIQSFPNILNQVLNTEILKKIFPRCRLWGISPLFNRSDVPSEVDAVSGACLMIKRSVFENVDMFSTRYFMYSEDIDLCYKVWEKGTKVYFVPMAIVVHHGGASSSQNKLNTFSDVMLLESQWRFFKKYKSIWYCNKYCIAMIFASLFRMLILSFSWPIFKLRGKSHIVEIALKKWTACFSWALGLEKWVDKY